MGSQRCDSRRRPSITLDAGYVSITSVNISQPSTSFDLHGNKLICVICTIVILLLVSAVNLSCLIWLMYKLDWSLFSIYGSKVFRFDKMNHQVEFYKQVTFKEPIYTTKIKNTSQIDFLIEKQIDIYGNQTSILLNDDQILLNTDKFYLKNNYSINFLNLQSFKFHPEIKTRIHLERFNSQYIHNKRLNLTAKNYLTISNINNAFFYGHNLVLEANRHNRRSSLHFNNHPKRKNPLNQHKKTSHGNFRLKSDSVFLDLPRYPLLGQNYRSDSGGIYRLCICNTTFLFLRSIAHQSCPLC